jgi:hypothetical protein
MFYWFKKKIPGSIVHTNTRYLIFRNYFLLTPPPTEPPDDLPPPDGALKLPPDEPLPGEGDTERLFDGAGDTERLFDGAGLTRLPLLAGLSGRLLGVVTEDGRLLPLSICWTGCEFSLEG